MRVLLDTHAYLWFLAGDERLSVRGREIISNPEADLLFSAASLWEIAIKHSLGKLPLVRPFGELFPSQLDTDDIRSSRSSQRTSRGSWVSRSTTGTRSTG